MKLYNLNQVIPAIVFITLLGLGGTSVMAQDADADQEQIVIDDLSKPELRAEIEKIQDEFYRVFNSSNADDEFDIICHDYTATGTNIPERACEPQFMIKRRGQNAKEYQDGIDELLSQSALLDELSVPLAQLTEKMNAIAAENEYFRELNQILQMLRARMSELE